MKKKKLKSIGYTKGQIGLIVGLGIIIVILATILVVVPPKDRTSVNTGNVDIR